MDKKEIAAALSEIGTLLELSGENPFKVRAYQNAARAVEQISGDFGEVVASGQLRELKGIGEGIAKKIAEIHETGTLAYLDELRAKIEPGLLEMLRIHGLGPKRIRLIRETLGITTLGELEYACKENRLKLLEGFGEKLQENVLRGIEDLKKYKDRHLWIEASQVAAQVVALLRGMKGVFDPRAAGSLRRCRETVGDIDILAAVEPKDRTRVAAALTGSKLSASVIASGDTKVSFKTPDGPNCDVRMVTLAEYPYALHHLTGSKEHNTAMRGRAQKLGFKMNEYGLFKGERVIPCSSEEEIFAALKLQYIPPELRENTGEIEAAEKDALPTLIEKDDIKGVIHVHTTWSDGRNTLDEMVRAAKDLGFSYLGLTDHSRSAAYAGGLSPEKVREQKKAAREAGDRFGIRVLFGTESDILADGSLDYDNKTLDLFDFVIGSVHSKFNMERGEMTRRILKAMEDPHLSIVGHLTGRLLLAREPYEVDQEVVLQAAARFGVVMELNANPNRLDLDWRMLREAARLGVLVSINPDAHEIEGLSDTFTGLGIARKGWLAAKDVVNTRSADEALAAMKRK